VSVLPASRIPLSALLDVHDGGPPSSLVATREVSGPWEVEGEALAVVDGFVMRDVVVERRVSSELLGPGDLAPARGEAHQVLGSSIVWRARGDAIVAELDADLLEQAAADRVLAPRLHERATQRAERLAAHAAILHMPQVRDRLLALLWQLADRWGRVTSEGILVRLPLTHDELGRMVGARRPTVTLAIGELVETGALVRAERKGYRLPLGSRELLEQAA
jgi:CRP/FNR family transcriptional regulator, cyclic AMP receptor protein